MKIITIGREFGSGGRELGKRLAERLGFAYYDEEILSAIAQKSGMAEAYVRSIVENSVPEAYPITYGRTLGGFSVSYDNHVNILRAQEGVLRELAEKRDCVIVGRCADTLLRDLKPLNLFVYADMDSKVKRCRYKASVDENLSDRELIRLIKKTERQRKEYYETVTGQHWGAKENYHLCINTSGRKVDGHEIKVQIPAIAAFCCAWFGE